MQNISAAVQCYSSVLYREHSKKDGYICQPSQIWQRLGGLYAESGVDFIVLNSVEWCRTLITEVELENVVWATNNVYSKQGCSTEEIRDEIANENSQQAILF